MNLPTGSKIIKRDKREVNIQNNTFVIFCQWWLRQKRILNQNHDVDRFICIKKSESSRLGLYMASDERNNYIALIFLFFFYNRDNVWPRMLTQRSKGSWTYWQHFISDHQDEIPKAQAEGSIWMKSTDGILLPVFQCLVWKLPLISYAQQSNI